MSKKTGYLIGILLTIIITMILSWMFCCNASGAADKDSLDDDSQKVVAPTPVATSMGFNLKDPDGNFAFNSNDNFNFNTSQFGIQQPIAASIDGSIDQLLNYLNSEGNSAKVVDITGFYDSDEENTSALANLGLARANAVKNYFVGKGIPSSRLNTFGKLNADLVPDGTLYRGPLSYAMRTQQDDGAAKEAAELKDLSDRINANPLVLYFNTAQSTMNLTAEQRQKIGDISRYLDKVEGSKVSIVGHTDGSGSRATNIPLGLKRANAVKEYLVRNGISASRINTTSKGEDEPIASDDTPEGMAKNRRSVVTIN